MNSHPLLSRLAVALAAGPATALLAGPAPAARAETVDQGVVQAASSTSLTLRRLDGTEVTIAIGPATTVRLNGRRSTIAAVEPGFVARAFHGGGAPARLVRALGTASPAPSRARSCGRCCGGPSRIRTRT